MIGGRGVADDLAIGRFGPMPDSANGMGRPGPPAPNQVVQLRQGLHRGAQPVVELLPGRHGLPVPWRSDLPHVRARRYHKMPGQVSRGAG
jgi:hypothetical protein